MRANWNAVLLKVVLLWSPPCWFPAVLPMTFQNPAQQQSLHGAWQAVEEVLQSVGGSQRSVIYVIDGDLSPVPIIKSVGNGIADWGVGVFVVNPRDVNENSTTEAFGNVLGRARKFRKLSRHVTIVVLSEGQPFLLSFSKAAKDARLLVGSTRLLVVTKQPLQWLKIEMRKQWTYAMMAATVLNLEGDQGEVRYGIYAHMPYTSSGPKILRLASWSASGGLALFSQWGLFPAKFKNFHRSQVNITALPFPPYWNVIEEAGPNGTKRMRYTGTDYLMVEAIAEALNFTIHVLPTANWNEVTKRVEERSSFIATVIYAVFPKRLEHYDYSYMFEYAFHAFTMAKPAIKPQWQSLYYPLTDNVWLCILLVILVMPVPFSVVIMKVTTPQDKDYGSINSGFLLQNIIGTLLAQGISGRIPNKHSYRLLFASWLVFAFIVGTAYRGNLTASLTAPKYPARVETLGQLVTAGARVTMPPYGAHFRDFFKGSDSTVFKTLGDRVDIVPTALTGVEEATMKKQAHMEARRYLELIIAEKFTKVDGSTELYIGQESVFPGLSAWPIPHDAPFKETLDRTIIAVIEGGLYEKWSEDLVSEARQASSKKKRELLEQQEAEGIILEINSAEGGTLALTIVHMQGPLLLLLLGLGTAGFMFATELTFVWCSQRNKMT